ncbi:hypothetical protein UJ101_02076 [Flavobacteriaceae bacterium UJ101]|nr:hypothetical protein UJ101_02076 [Flavobacteriaceae bacterium UJ101]
MKSIKNILALTLIGFSLLAYSQRGFKPLSVEEMTTKQLEKINEKIELDDLQKSLLEVHLTNLNNDRKEIMSSNEDRDLKKEKMQQLDQSYLPKFQEILSTEQYKQFLEVRDEMEKERQQKRGFKGNRNNYRNR